MFDVNMKGYDCSSSPTQRNRCPCVYMYLHYASIIDAYVYHFRNRIFGYYYWKWNLPKLPGLSFGRYVGRLVGQFGGGS